MIHPGKHSTGAVLSCLIALTAVWMLNHRIIGQLGDVLFGISPDACKNYYTVLWHVKWDQSAAHFEGMNHPYGDHIAFADAQPALSNLLRLFHTSPELSIAIMNALMLFSVVFTVLLLYLILRRLKLPVFYSIVFALLISFLSPQLQRLTGHYGLSYSWAVPLIIYLSLWYDKQRKWWQSLLIGLVLFVLSGLHMYYYAMAAFIITGSMFFESVYEKDKRKLRQLFHWGIQVALPFLLIQGWLRFDILIPDRPYHPTGFLKSAANWRSVFLPVGFPEWKWLYKSFPCHCSFNGIAFTGTTVAIFILVTGIRKLSRLIKLRWSGLHIIISDDRMFNYLFWSSVTILFLSFGWPFKFNLESWLYYTGAFQQLRGIGRMAWVFYYCAGIAASCGLWRYWNTQRKPGALLVLIGALGLWTYQVIFYNIHHQIKPYHNIFIEQADIFKANNQSKEQYQAVIPLPWFHVGSENLSVPPKDNVLMQVCAQSLRSGIPLTACEMSRTSFSQTWKQMQFMQDAFCNPELLNDIQSSKPFIIWLDKRWPLKPGEKQLLSVSEPICENDTVALYKLSIKDAVSRHQKVAEAVNNALPPDSLCYITGSFMATDTGHYLLNFDDSILGYTGMMSIQDTLLNTVLNNLDTGQYMLSLWLQVNRDELPSLRIRYIQGTKENPALEWIDYRADELMDGIGPDGWLLASMDIRIHTKGARHKLVLYKNGGRAQRYKYRSLLIIKDDVQLFRRDERKLWINNRIYTLSGLQ